jgi:formylglycine-generating enzyme required for sulfatase activity
MKRSITASRLCSLACVLLALPAHAQITLSELVAPKMEISDGNLNFTIQPSVSGRNYQLQWSDSTAGGTWTDVGVLRSGEDGTNVLISTPHVAGVQKRFYRVALVEATAAPAGFSLIPEGWFEMGDPFGEGWSGEWPVHSVYVSAFYMGRYEVTKALWDEVRTWGLHNGYTDLPVGNEPSVSKGAKHPVFFISWYAMVKWCNARSEKESLVPCYTVSGSTYKTGYSAPDCNWNASGYRLPTEAEWEKAARGGLSNKRFPWGDTITHSQANYYSSTSYAYDVSPTRGYHPTYDDGVIPYTSPVGSFPANGYGLYDMAGNLWEWCWDWGSSGYYSDPSAGTDPRGPASGSGRVFRGGGWGDRPLYLRVTGRSYSNPGGTNINFGFRVARSSVP